MRCLVKISQIVLTLAFSAVSLGTVHATFPGENGVILSNGPGPHVLRTAADGSGNATTLAYGVDPAASPNGRQVALVGASEELQIVNIDGSNLTSTGVTLASLPAWSPDGTKIAFIKAFSVYILDVATKATSYLAPLPSAGPVVNIGWSLSGENLLLGAGYGSYLVGVSNGQVTQIATLGSGKWFPDGKAIVALTRYPESCAYRVGLDGSAQSLSGCGLFAPAISPDGLTLLANLNGTTTLTSRTLSGQNVKTIPGGIYSNWSRVPKTAMRSTLSNGQWSPATPLANDSDSYLSEADMAVMPDGAAGYYQRQVVGIGVDGRLYHRAQHIGGTWTPYAVVPGGSGSPSGIHAKRVAIAGALDGSAQVVIVGANDLVYHAVRYTNGSWSGFNLVGGYSGAANFAARDVAIAIVNSTTTTPGQAHVVGNGLQHGDVYHRVRLDGGGWTPWLPISAQTAQTNQVAIAFDGSANAFVLTTSPTQGVMRRVRFPSGNWNSWVHMPSNGSYPLKDVSLSLSSALPLAWVGYIGVDGGVWAQKIDNPLLDASWTQPLLAPTHVMDKARGVSIDLDPSVGPEVVVVQVQPQ